MIFGEMVKMGCVSRYLVGGVFFCDLSKTMVMVLLFS